MRIAIVHGNDGSDVRVGKLCRTLSRFGHDVDFIGWDRRPSDVKSIDLGSANMHILDHATVFGRATLGGQFKFAAHVYRTLKHLRPTVVSCVNEDTALLALPFKRFLYDRLICEIFDALVDRHSSKNWPIRSVVAIVSLISRWGADRLIVTDEARLNRVSRFKQKCIVIENYPEDPGNAAGRKPLTGPFRIFVSGSLNLNRGLRQILSAVDSVDDFQIVSAGWLYDEFASLYFSKHTKVDFRGILTSKMALDAAADCDAIFAFYAPTSTNNLYASPNKIYDALSVGRPTIINSEIYVANWVTENKLGWDCGYDDAYGLEQILYKVKANRSNIRHRANRFRELFVGRFSWNSIEDRIEDAYTNF